jgi:hypothetical protein
MILSSPIKFSTGRIVIAPAALTRLSPEDIHAALDRHVTGDWGDLDEEDREENEKSLATGHRLLSVYHNRAGVTFWIITEADRSMTNVFLPESHQHREIGIIHDDRGHETTRKPAPSADRSAPKPGAAPARLTFRFRTQ